jgi:hypothetical protein
MTRADLYALQNFHHGRFVLIFTFTETPENWVRSRLTLASILLASCPANVTTSPQFVQGWLFPGTI